MEIIIIFTIHNHIYIYIYTFTIHNQNHHDLIHIPILHIPKMSKRAGPSLPMDHPGRQGGMMFASWEASRNCIQVPAKPLSANICREMENLQGLPATPQRMGAGCSKEKKNCRGLTKCSKGMMCEGKIMENPR